MKKGPEGLIVKACLDLLELKQIFHYRNNTGALKTQQGYFIKFGAKGSPDIVAVIKGCYIGIECKAKSKQGEDQKEFQRKLEKAGGLYWLIRSIDELLLRLAKI